MEQRHKYADLIHAWFEGSEIQYQDPFNQEWIDINPPSWDERLEYRIKPAEKKPVIRYKYAYQRHDHSGWFETEEFISDEEAAQFIEFGYVKLEYTRTEFPE